MELTLLRHAESEYNKKGLLQGRIDCDLSAEGIEQTKKRAMNFDSSNYDVCFTSPLKRTLNTAQILVPDLEIICDDRIIESPLKRTLNTAQILVPDLEIICDDRIIERSLGDFEDTPTSDEKKFLLNNIDSTPPNGESTAEITKRVEEFIEFLKANYSDKRVLVISHAGIVYALQVSLGLEVKSIDNLETLTIDVNKK